ncbi:MAG TPA: hypothetical protein VKY73_24665 [Polyangiaceae bacterium]|nr:hypothetical protein [Polyangiaceae bacterium]
MAKGTRKIRRTQEARDDGDRKSEKPLVPKPQLQDPLSGTALRGMLLRLGLPLLAVWMLCAFIASLVYSSTAKVVLIAIPAVLTVLAIGLVVWALRQAKKARGVAGILSQVETAEDRKAALEKLETGFKKNDPAALFARAQLELQEDPKKALATLEQIDLNKVMAPVADEARGQRAMIHLVLGEVSAARQLVDGINLSRHQEPRTRAMLAAVCAEAWARSGAAKKATETLALFDSEDPAFEPIRPQLYRAFAYAYAHTGDIKGIRRMLKRLSSQDARMLSAFMMKRTHPLLQREAKKLLEQSGAVPRRIIIDRGG